MVQGEGAGNAIVSDKGVSRTLINIGAAIGLAGILTCLGTALDRWDELRDQQRAMDDSIAQAQADRRRDLAAKRACGPNAEPVWTSATEVACKSNGHRVRRHTIAEAAP